MFPTPNVLFQSSSDLLKGVLEQSLSGHWNLDMAGQGIGLHRDRKQRRKEGRILNAETVSALCEMETMLKFFWYFL